MFMVPSLAIMVGLSFLSPRQVRRVAVIMLIASLLMMIFALFFGIEVKGARRWISIGTFSIQPSEFMKPDGINWRKLHGSRLPVTLRPPMALLLFSFTDITTGKN